MRALAADPARWGAGLLGIALGLAIAAVVARAAAVLARAVGLIDIPVGLDYGEGIVIEQAVLIGAGAGYGDVALRPHIVFHYPPVYHAAVLALHAAIGPALDAVGAGRVVSVASALAVAVCAGWLAAAILGEDAGPGPRAAAAIAGAGLVFVPPAVANWVPVARVDMLAMAFSFLGLVLAAPRDAGFPRIAAAGLCFVLAGFTKQTSIAALGAAAIVLMAQDRGRALQLLGVVAALGLAGLGFGQWATDGRFLRHVVGFNVNRYSLDHLLLQLGTMLPTATLALLPAAAVILHRQGRLQRAAPAGSRAFAMVLAQFALCTLLLPLAGKIGSNWNYFIEWYVAGAILGGALAGEIAWRIRQGARRTPVATLACTVMAAAIVLQVAVVPPASAGLAEFRRVSADVARQVRAAIADAPGDVVSDDMVLLLRSGRRVLLEPAIFAELTSLGRWDERLLTEPLRSGRIGLLVTEGAPGGYVFDQRYTPSIQREIDAALPRKDAIGWFLLHRPAARRDAANP